MTTAPKMGGPIARFVVDDLRRRRLPVDGLLKEVGLSKTELNDPEARLPYVSVVKLLQGAAHLTADPCYGLRLGASRNARERGLLGFVALNSPTLMDAVVNLQRFYKIVREGGEFEIERNGPVVAVKIRESDPALRGLKHNIGFLVASLVRGCRDLTRQAIPPLRVELTYEEPDAKVRAEYAEVLGCPVEFGAKEWVVLAYPEEAMRLPVEGADAKLLKILEQACQKIVGPASPKTQDLVYRVRELIIERLPKSSANIDAIADELNIGSKTLERRLAERGESFSTLLDETRQKAVKHYLEATDLRLSEVAYMVGYTEPAALVRAFKRWTGETPSQFREAAVRSAQSTS